jgi:putative membrane protein
VKRLLTPVCACLAAAAIAAVPTAGAKSSKSSSKVSAADEQYLQTSISGDRFEIIGGKWAQSHSKSAAVLRAADRIVSDHTKSLSDAIKLAHSLKIDVPSSPTPSQVWELKMVASLHGKAYNHWYASLEVYDHVQDIEETTNEIDSGTNSQIRDDAKTELPMLKLHLKLARAALAANPQG